MYWIYSFLYGLALLISLPYWLIGMARAGKYRAGLMERFGAIAQRLELPKAGERSIWIHAVSVGEVLAVAGLVEGLKTEFPEKRLFVSTTTLTGQTLARRRFGEENVFYLPLDLPFAINRYLNAITPQILILAETEFWPNLLRLTKKGEAQVVVVNARISDRSLPGYRRFRSLLREVLRNLDLLLAQTELDRDRLIAIGAAGEKVLVGGNLKFDVKSPSESSLSRALRQSIAPDQRVLVFGSTVEGEEPLLVPCVKRVFSELPQALIILAPRHPERFDSVAEILRDSGISFWRRSSWSSSPLGGGVLLLDSIGELASLYSLADLAFVGGSLVPRGGHNILEPAQFGKPILIGPHYDNFREIVRTFLARDAVRVVNAEQLTSTVLSLLQAPEDAVAFGSRAKSVIESGRGSTQRTLSELRRLLGRNTAVQLGVSGA
ncbi:MAG: 3-deoxy-D-manno-octulosonic acid transferase [Acidobacteria bacterium]|nr:MAG: 3-deoxy-D-manno-octulosonic acid transferase [Acidobacteriota bacterium]PYY03166.1 MAG: 3-deoxy-D-manno-octulosonic acid transferase [Acidobacteriota bacterium]PYY23691.1 MAG: 3-deoxy-D-manno-octulosonic acid transferase [Acidobacteriota bacterium]